jgi:hypothetical protein
MGDALYSDSCLILDEDGLTIRRYYFPLGSEKRISYADIRGVQTETMNWWTGKGRWWGTGDPRGWLPLDLRRHRKDTLLVFDVGQRVKPCVSPDDPDRVVELLRTRVAVT